MGGGRGPPPFTASRAEVKTRGTRAAVPGLIRGHPGTLVPKGCALGHLGRPHAPREAPPRHHGESPWDRPGSLAPRATPGATPGHPEASWNIPCGTPKGRRVYPERPRAGPLGSSLNCQGTGWKGGRRPPCEGAFTQLKGRFVLYK